jgi:hypothetical protein
MASPRQLQFALMMRGAQEGFSGQQILDLFQEFGLGMRRQDFYRLFGEARRVVAEAGQEATRPVDQVPTLAESAPIAANPTAEPGVLQTVRLVYREKETNNLRTVFYSVKSDAGITRQQAINQAIDQYEAHSEEYQTTLVAAAHTSAIRIVPTELAA